MADTPEHIRLVDDACVQYFKDTIRAALRDSDKSSIREPTFDFTLGEISSMAGDFYATPDEFLKDAEAAHKFVRGELIQKLKKNKGELQIIEAMGHQGRRFADLATKNHGHFRLGSTTDNAIGNCKFYHNAARDTSSRNLKLLYEGFALHYLVDLFSSGHMRTPRFALEQYLKQQLSYDSLNAEIVGSLLALIQHDSDNKRGLECEWYEDYELEERSAPDGMFKNPRTDSTSTYPSDTERTAVNAKNGNWTYWGDDSMDTNATVRFRSMGKTTSRARRHLTATIASHIIDAFNGNTSDVVSPGHPTFPLGNLSKYKQFSTNDKSAAYPNLLLKSIPNPFHKDRSTYNHEGRLFYVSNNNAAEFTRLWATDTEVPVKPNIACNFSGSKPFSVKEGKILVEVTAGTTAPYRLLGVKVQLSKTYSFFSASVTAALNGAGLIGIAVDQKKESMFPQHLFRQMDGNDSDVREIFKRIGELGDRYAFSDWFGEVSRPPDR